MVDFIGSNPKHKEWQLHISNYDAFVYSETEIENCIRLGKMVWVLDDSGKGTDIKGITGKDALNIINVYRNWWRSVSG